MSNLLQSIRELREFNFRPPQRARVFSRLSIE